MKTSLAIIGCLFVITAGALLIPLRWGVWLPDLVNPGVIVLDELVATNGDRMRLTQLWVGDGYATEFFHTEKSGHSWTFAIDGDARKAWSGRLERTNHSLHMSVLNLMFAYDMKTHVVTDLEGKPLMVEEIPPGVPIVPPR